jgi:hypothetical protein
MTEELYEKKHSDAKDRPDSSLNDNSEEERTSEFRGCCIEIVTVNQ